MKTWRLLVAAMLLPLLAACSDPEGDWQKAASENTEAAWRAFMEKHPDVEWTQKAQAELDSLKDSEDWENARTADAVEAYNNYLLEHPTGAHMGEARQRVTELEAEAAWNAASTAGTREALEEFLLRYGDTSQGEQARAQLAALVPPAPPPAAEKPAASAAKKPVAVTKPATTAKGDWLVQLGAFSDSAKAQAEKARMEQRFKGVVGSLAIQQPSGADRLWRVKSGAMTETAARSACRSLKGSGQDCVVVHR